MHTNTNLQKILAVLLFLSSSSFGLGVEFEVEVDQIPKPKSLLDWVKVIQVENYELRLAVNTHDTWIAVFRAPDGHLAINIEPYGESKGKTVSWGVFDRELKLLTISNQLDERMVFTKFTINGELQSGKLLNFIIEQIPPVDEVLLRVNLSGDLIFNEVLDWN